jgi:very-short-patch-repair endonuclease
MGARGEDRCRMTNTSIIYNPHGLKNVRRNLRKISTEAENKLWKFLRNKFLGQRFYRQFGIEHLSRHCEE